MGSALTLLGGCALFQKPRQRAGPITHIEVHKRARRLHAYSGNRRVHDFKIGLGFNPIGHKVKEGDGRTPVGRYYVDRKNPQSLFNLSLGLNYPDRADKQLAAARGVDPGGDIFIHGQPNRAKVAKTGDWTEGCIAVSDREMEILFATVDIGTPVHINH